jgi:hypothetical protein
MRPWSDDLLRTYGLPQQADLPSWWNTEAVYVLLALEPEAEADRIPCAAGEYRWMPLLECTP